MGDAPDKGIGSGAKSIARMESVHLMDLGVQSLATRGSGGKIALSCWRPQPFGPDKASYAYYSLDDDASGKGFFQQIKPALESTNLNTWGVLLVLSVLINKYDNDVFATPPAGTAAPNFAASLNISLTK